VCDCDKQFIGRASVLPEQLNEMEGILSLTLHDAGLSPVGTISCEKLEQIEILCDMFPAVDYIVILPCAALDGCSVDDQWREHFWSALQQPLIFGHRGNGMSYKTDPLVYFKMSATSLLLGNNFIQLTPRICSFCTGYRIAGKFGGDKVW